MKHFITLILLIFSSMANAADTARFLQLVDYVGVDYPAAVENGKVINPGEYEEMQEFASTILEQAKQLDPQAPGAKLISQAEKLQQLVANHANPDEVSAISAAMRLSVLSHFSVQATPRTVPDLQLAKQIYMNNCVSCHGATGMGDGPLAQNLEPAPTNFREVARYRERTLYGLYSTISIGVEGTAMQGYAASLSESERWALAFYTGQMAGSPELQKEGESLWKNKTVPALADLKTLTTTTPAEAEQRYGKQGLAVMSYLRQQPQELFSNRSPLDFARAQTEKSLATYKAGDKKQAYQQALSAYLDGFELAEHGVDAVDHELRLQIESAMTSYREMIKHAEAFTQVEPQAKNVLSLLDEAGEVLQSKSLSSSAAFGGAFIILVREGLEALLVIAALAAFLLKTDRRDGLRYLHMGWIGALLLGIATWLGSQYLFDFSGANREITEGAAALIAMLVLFYVGFWLHSKTAASQWKRFIEDSINRALEGGTMWAIAGLSFIAVYREVFETILFYQAMWVQAERNAQASLVAGVIAGSGILVLLAWLILRYSTRLPLRQFFSYTSVFMFVLAIVFAGKGIAALQEAGIIPLSPVTMPSIDILGIYPNIEGIALQLILLIMAALILFRSKQKNQ